MCHQSNYIMCHSPHPLTPINRSLHKALLIYTHLEGHLGRHQHTKTSTLQVVSKKIQSIDTLLESSPKDSRNFKLKYEKHLKQNHSNHLPSSQNSLESS